VPLHAVRAGNPFPNLISEYTMKQTRLFVLPIAALTLSLALAGCGGGGSNDAASTATTPAKDSTPTTTTSAATPAQDPAPTASVATPAQDATPATSATTLPASEAASSTSATAPSAIPALPTITASNYTVVATHSYGAAQALIGNSSLSDSLVTGITLNAAPPSLATQAIDLLMLVATSGPTTVTGVAISIACQGGGTIQSDATVQVAGKISKGDSFVISTLDCRQTVDGPVMKGNMTVTFNELDGTISALGPWKATIAYTLDNFSLAVGDSVGVISGSMILEINQINQSNRITRITGASLRETQKLNILGNTQNSVTLSDKMINGFVANGIMFGAKSIWAVNYGLGVTSDSISRLDLAVKTLQPLVFAGGPDPVSGSIVVTGVNSSVTITALDGNTVRLDLSAQGDGTITDSKTITWAQLKSGA
jgi:hypothetical protein